jgi:hypothetical protein
MTGPSGDVTMAKQGRSIQLPPAIYELAEAVEARSGVRFNRQLLAALLAYYFSHPDGPEAVWMEYAVAIEKGDLKIADVPEKQHDRAYKVLTETFDAGHPDLARRFKLLRMVHAGRCQQWAHVAEQVAKGAGDLFETLTCQWVKKPFSFQDAGESASADE